MEEGHGGIERDMVGEDYEGWKEIFRCGHATDVRRLVQVCCCVNMGLLICLSEDHPCFHFFPSICVRYLSSNAHVSILVQTGGSVCMLISAHKSGDIVVR